MLLMVCDDYRCSVSRLTISFCSTPLVAPRIWYAPLLIPRHLTGRMILFLIAIPTVKNGGNHTTAFAESAATITSYNACLDVSKALASAGVRVLADDEFFAKV